MKPVLHLVPHTHWDREWYLTFQQFRIKLVHLIDNLLAILEDDPNYAYFMLDGQTIILEDYLSIRPERTNELKNHLQNNRIQIGPWYILPDEFLVSPEAHIRNLLQGERDCQKYAQKMNIGYLPDTFGHIGQMPQILHGFGFETACLWRGLDDQPCELTWQAPDGTNVLLLNMRDSYSNGAGLPTSKPEAFTKTLERINNSLEPYSVSNHRLVMFGTDHMEPAPETTFLVQHTNTNLNNIQVIQSSLPKYLDSLINELDFGKLPVVKGELRSSKRSHLLPGVLSTRMWIKQRNHACETLLEKWAEPYSLWAGLVEGDAYQTNTLHQTADRLVHPSGLIQQAWRILMQNHPHDSICGCSIDQVHEEMESRFDQVEQIGEVITEQSLTVIASKINTSQIPESIGNAAAAIVVFNPLPNSRTDYVSTQLHLPKGIDNLELVAEDGRAIPFSTHSGENISLFNMTITSEDLKNAINMIQDGKISNLAVSEMTVEQIGDTAELSLILTEDNQVDVETWTRGLNAVQALLDDPNIKNFHIVAKSAKTVEITFIAKQVPGTGYATFWVTNKESDSHTAVKLGRLEKSLFRIAPYINRIPGLNRILEIRKTQTPKPPYRIENEFFQIEASSKDGSLTVKDLKTGIVYTGLNQFIDGADSGDEYNYSPPEKDRLIQNVRVKQIAVNKSSTQSSLIMDLSMALPKSLSTDRKTRSFETLPVPINTQIILSTGIPRIDIHTTIDNKAKDHRLRVHFPVPFHAHEAWHDGHFEIVKREIGVPSWDETWAEEPRPEKPQRAFTALAGNSFGLMVANRGLPEVEAMQRTDGTSEIALTLLRCVGWLSRDDFSTRKNHAGPFLPTPGAQLNGIYSFDYSIIPFGNPENGFSSACLQAYAFNAPFRSKNIGIQTGNLPYQTSMVQIDSPDFLISTIKTSESPPKPGESCWIVRGFNPSQKTIHVTIKPWRKPYKANLTNLAENTFQELDLQVDGSVQVKVDPNKIITVQFTHSLDTVNSQ